MDFELIGVSINTADPQAYAKRMAVRVRTSGMDVG